MGGKFTWLISNGKAMSRINGFLLSESFIEDWKVEAQSIGVRVVSDHSPIWINENLRNWGPKPFRFNNGWLKHTNFKSFVKEEWQKICVKGRGDFFCGET